MLGSDQNPRRKPESRKKAQSEAQGKKLDLFRGEKCFTEHQDNSPASGEDQTTPEQRRRCRWSPLRVFTERCLKDSWCLAVFHWCGWERLRLPERRNIVFHNFSGGDCPLTITMLLHYHENSSIGARDSKKVSFFVLFFGSVAAFSCLRVSE